MALLVSRFVFFAAGMVLFGSSLFALYAGLGRVTRGIGETDTMRWRADCPPRPLGVPRCGRCRSRLAVLGRWSDGR